MDIYILVSMLKSFSINRDIKLIQLKLEAHSGEQPITEGVFFFFLNKPKLLN